MKPLGGARPAERLLEKEAAVDSPADASCHHAYVHVPFCARRCSYCDFSIAVRRVVPWREFAEGVRLELDLRFPVTSSNRALLHTLYLGGGTPSALGSSGVEALMDVLSRRFDWGADAEVTLEANPEDVSIQAVRRWRAAGINRLSIGVQSFHDDVLRWMHRVHDARAAADAVAMAREGGIEAHSIDLIFAMPDAIPRSWSRDVERALLLGVDHVSLYGLTVESGSPLGRWRDRGLMVEADESRYEREFLEAHEYLVAAGYEHYEVSNYARTGRRARHNSAYWQGVPYLGLGPSAHGFDGITRRWNEPAWTRWISLVKESRDPMCGYERLSPENRIAESVYLGMRTIDGLSVNVHEAAHVAPWLDAGWIELFPEDTVRTNDHARSEGRNSDSLRHDFETPTYRLRCTPMGWLRLDALAADLTAFRSRS